MKYVALLALALAASMQATPIWSYQFTETNPDAAFQVWHDGPIVTSFMEFIPGDQLHSCTVGPRTYCDFVSFSVLGNDLGVVFSRQGLDMDHNTPASFIFPNARLDTPGIYAAITGGAAWLLISNDPAGLAPEPTTWGMLALGLACAVWRSRSGRQSKADR